MKTLLDVLHWMQRMDPNGDYSEALADCESGRDIPQLAVEIADTLRYWKSNNYGADDDGKSSACETAIRIAEDASRSGGKPVAQAGEFDASKAKIGDLVSREVVDDFMDCLPPACYRSDCAQLGEPYSMKQDPETGDWRSTFLTFRHVDGDVWMYCGKCFRGENEERGNPIPCVSIKN